VSVDSPHLHQDIAGIGVRRAETVAVGDSVPIGSWLVVTVN
jgi:hypothetical protein